MRLVKQPVALAKRSFRPGTAAQWITYMHDMRVLAAASGLCLASGNLHGAAAKSERPVVSNPPAAPSRLADATVPLIDQALHLADFPNMEPRDDLRSKLMMVSSFIQ